jgi:glutathione S-transferase
LIAIADGLTADSVLVGDFLSLADLAVAAQLSLLRFPASSGPQLAGRGVAGLSDHPRLQPLFEWRDRLDARLLQQDPAAV